MHQPNESHTKRLRIEPSSEDVNKFIRSLFVTFPHLKHAQAVPILRGGSYLTSYVSHAVSEPIQAVCGHFGLATLNARAFHCEDVIFIEDIIDTGKTISKVVSELGEVYSQIIEVHVIALASKKKGEKAIEELNKHLSFTIDLHSMYPGIDDNVWVEFPWEDLDKLVDGE